MKTQVTDFSRSYVRWSIDGDPADQRRPGHMLWGNSVRLLIDARCFITASAGETTEMVLIAPCRKEWMYRERGLIMDPGAEYRAMFSADRQVDVAMQCRIEGDRPLPATTSGFRELHFEIASHEARSLTSESEIIEASASGTPLVVQTRINGGDVSAVLEYPIRTMNYHPERGRFQVDTGPHIFPVLDQLTQHPIDCCRLAHTVFNTLEYAEFACRPAGDEVAAAVEGVGLRRYSDLHGIAVVHQFFALA